MTATMQTILSQSNSKRSPPSPGVRQIRLPALGGVSPVVAMACRGAGLAAASHGVAAASSSRPRTSRSKTLFGAHGSSSTVRSHGVGVGRARWSPGGLRAVQIYNPAS